MAYTTSPTGATGCTTINGPFQLPYRQYINCQPPGYAFPPPTIADYAPTPVATSDTTPLPDHAIAHFWHPVDFAITPTLASEATHGHSISAPPSSLPTYALLRDPTMIINNNHNDLSGQCCLPIFPTLLAVVGAIVGFMLMKWFATEHYPPIGTNRGCTTGRWRNGLLNAHRRPRTPDSDEESGRSHHSGSSSGYGSATSTSSSATRPRLQRRPGTDFLREQFQQEPTLRDLLEYDNERIFQIIDESREIRRRY
ncbi:hypothetical protein OHC33_005856 [Knufia fluminis]|uniref:Uncharacterized protein n=1 Tax=Knufia fluminis TaxID=191047 RepID=A0AAN8EK55_9EURO|nr:hypothetical protein OHC33_005856 [Knufia fluminis]